MSLINKNIILPIKKRKEKIRDKPIKGTKLKKERKREAIIFLASSKSICRKTLAHESYILKIVATYCFGHDSEPKFIFGSTITCEPCLLSCGVDPT